MRSVETPLYYPSGAPYRQFLEGRLVYFYEGGGLKTVEPYQEGALHGEVLLYWPNGTLKRRSFFERGVRSGLDQMWARDGQILDEGHYFQGKGVGEHRRWTRLGALIERICYLDSSRFDFWQWDEEGNLRIEAVWDKDCYRERVWDRFSSLLVEKKGHWDGKRLVYF